VVVLLVLLVSAQSSALQSRVVLNSSSSSYSALFDVDASFIEDTTQTRQMAGDKEALPHITQPQTTLRVRQKKVFLQSHESFTHITQGATFFDLNNTH